MSKLFKNPEDLSSKVTEAKYLQDLKKMLKDATALKEEAGIFILIHEYQFDKAAKPAPLLLVDPKKAMYQHVKENYEKDDITLGQIFFKPKPKTSTTNLKAISAAEGDDLPLFTTTQVGESIGIIELVPTFGVKKMGKIKKSLKVYKAEFLSNKLVFDVMEKVGVELLEKAGTKLFSTSTYGEIAHIVKHYPTIEDHKEQFVSLKSLEKLIAKWMDDHGNSTREEDVDKKEELANIKKWIGKQRNKGLKLLEDKIKNALVNDAENAETNIAFSFRLNTEATKLVVAQLESSGEEITELFRNALDEIIPVNGKNLSVNPEEVNDELKLQENKQIIRDAVIAFMAYIKSDGFIQSIPSDIKKLCQEIYNVAYENFKNKGKEEAHRQGLELAKAFLVLRFLAPKVSMLNLNDNTFTLIAKIFNSKANGAKAKDEKMVPFNDLIDERDADILEMLEKILAKPKDVEGTKTKKTVGLIKNGSDLEQYAELITDENAKQFFLANYAAQSESNELVKFFRQAAVKGLHDPQKNVYKNTYVAIILEGENDWGLYGLLDGKAVKKWDLVE